MSKSDPSTSQKGHNSELRWVITIFLVTIVISAAISLISDEIMGSSGIVTAFLILLAIVLVGILFDIIGVAVTSADETPFHSMASRKVPGAQESIRLLRNASKVGSICNDVIGDICGVVSGSASATIAALVISKTDFGWPQVVTLAMSALVAGLTVGGKALGKSFAMNSATVIVHTVGRAIYGLHHISDFIGKKKNKR